MSSILFQSQTGGEVRISGRERAMMATICDRFMMAQIGNFDFADLSWLKRVAKPGHYLHDGAIKLESASDDYEKARLKNQLKQELRTWLNVGDDETVLQLNGEPVELFSMSVNLTPQESAIFCPFAGKIISLRMRELDATGKAGGLCDTD